eukprot:1764909-Pleurochrysis_carterae.AAC.1
MSSADTAVAHTGTIIAPSDARPNWTKGHPLRARCGRRLRHCRKRTTQRCHWQCVASGRLATAFDRDRSRPLRAQQR